MLDMLLSNSAQDYHVRPHAAGGVVLVWKESPVMQPSAVLDTLLSMSLAFSVHFEPMRSTLLYRYVSQCFKCLEHGALSTVP